MTNTKGFGNVPYVSVDHKYVINICSSSDKEKITYSNKLVAIFLHYFRCLAICRPLSSFDWRTTKRAKRVILVVYILSLFYGGMVVYTTSYSGPKNCTSVGKGSKITEYLSWFMLVAHSLFPFFGILTMNIMMVKTIRNRPTSDLGYNEDSKSEISDTHFETNSPSTISSSVSVNNFKLNETGISSQRRRQSGKGKESSRQLAIMLLSVSFSFLILTSPVAIRNVIYALGLFTVTSNREAAQSALIIAITSRLILVNGVINFWLYFITGQKFRQDLKNIVRLCVTKIF